MPQPDGTFAMHFLMDPQGSFSIFSSSVIDQVLLVLVNLRFMYIEGKIPKGYSAQYGENCTGHGDM